MCVIIHKQIGVSIHPEVLSSAWKHNPHGWGIMYAEDGKVETRKGLEFDTFLEAYGELGDREILIHFRFATHGALNVANCHPFKVTDDLYLMHNGMLKVDEYDENMSDTWHFAELLRLTLYESPELIHQDGFLLMLENLIGHNKIVLMDGQGRIVFLNRELGCEYKGLWLSNSSRWDDPDAPVKVEETKRTPTPHKKREAQYESLFTDYDNLTRSDESFLLAAAEQAMRTRNKDKKKNKGKSKHKTQDFGGTRKVAGSLGFRVM